MSTVAFIRACRARGLDWEAALAAAEAHEAANADALETRRSKDAARQQARRDRIRHVTSRESQDSRDAPLETKVSPAPPSKTQSPSPPSPPKGGSSPTILADFDRFWDAYPLKVGKGAARKAYPTALAKIPGPEPPAVLLRALDRVKPTWTDAQFIPHASTWLNQERWEDEPEPRVITLRQPHDRPDRDSRQSAREENYARSLAGFEIASRGRGER